jgi:hypothetical protein
MSTPTPPAVDPSAMVSQSAPPSIPQAPPQTPTYSNADEVATNQGESWAMSGGGSDSGLGGFLHHLLGSVGEVLAGPKTAQTVDQSGNIVNAPLSGAQRARNVLGTILTGASAGAAQHGPGAVGKAALAGVQAEQGIQQQNHKDLMDSASVAMRNNQWLLQQREFDLRSQEFQRQIIDSDNALSEHMDDLGATKPVIPGPGGKDANGTSDEASMMAWRAANKPAPGTHYVPTSTLENGKRVYTIYQVPHDSLKDERAYSPEESAALGLPAQTSYLTLKDALSFQELHAKNSGLAESAKKYQDTLSGPFHPPTDQVDAKAQLSDQVAAYRFLQANPQYATKEQYQELHDRATQIHDLFPSLAPQPLAAQETQAKINESKSATTKNYAEAAAARANAGTKGDELVVAFDPTAQNEDGTKGQNIVMPRAQAAQNKLQHYKADPATLNGTIAGINDVQVKMNKLADVVNSPDMAQVDARLSGYLTGDPMKLSAFGSNINVNGIDAALRNIGINNANQPTKNFIVAYLGAHEAISQLPRLQTFGKSSRVSQTQMEQAAKMLPQPGDPSDFAQQKLDGVQDTLDPIRRQVPRMQGAPLIPTYRERPGYGTKQTTQAPPPAAKPKVDGVYDPNSKTIQWNPL